MLPEVAALPGLLWLHALRVRAERPSAPGVSSALWKAP